MGSSKYGQSGDVLLDVKDLCVDYLAADGAVHAVNHVNLRLHRGEILGLAGESGCGKSTLAYAILRLLRPPAMVTNGEVLYYPRQTEGTESASDRLLVQIRKLGKNGNGHGASSDAIDVLSLTSRQLRAVRWNELSIVFQSAMNSLNPVLTVGSQIMDVLYTHQPGKGRDYYKKRAAELLELVGISADRLGSYPHELSGGMRQRAVIAIALALNPELIIMDEPTTALDVVVQRKILDMMVELCQRLGMALIFVTHDLSLLLEMADRVAVMYAGNLVELTSAAELYRRPRHPYSYGLLNSFPTLHQERRKMAGIPGSPPDLRAAPSGCTFHPRCPFAFEPCTRVVPPLQSLEGQNNGALLACHLYDKRFRAEPPVPAEYVGRYERMAESRPAGALSESSVEEIREESGLDALPTDGSGAR
jgi:peptide/nickel transport system ATP-binding protein